MSRNKLRRIAYDAGFSTAWVDAWMERPKFVRFIRALIGGKRITGK